MSNKLRSRCCARIWKRAHPRRTLRLTTTTKVAEIEEKYNDDHNAFEKAFDSVIWQVGNLEKKIKANAQQTDRVMHEFMKRTSDDVNGMPLVHTHRYPMTVMLECGKWRSQELSSIASLTLFVKCSGKLVSLQCKSLVLGLKT